MTLIFEQNISTVTPVLINHCNERPPLLKDHIFLEEGPILQCNWPCHKGPPVFRAADEPVLQDRFHCTVFKGRYSVYLYTATILYKIHAGPNMVYIMVKSETSVSSGVHADWEQLYAAAGSPYWLRWLSVIHPTQMVPQLVTHTTPSPQTCSQ